MCSCSRPGTPRRLCAVVGEPGLQPFLPPYTWPTLTCAPLCCSSCPQMQAQQADGRLHPSEACCTPPAANWHSDLQGQARPRILRRPLGAERSQASGGGALLCRATCRGGWPMGSMGGRRSAGTCRACATGAHERPRHRSRVLQPFVPAASLCHVRSWSPSPRVARTSSCSFW
jgi:hypothetical protein